MSRRWQTLGAAVILTAAGVAVYWNSLDGAFLFDDLLAIRDNVGLAGAPFWQAAQLPVFRNRPMAGLTIGINYALGGLDVRGYHAFNLAVHVLAALTLFSIVRRTLGGPRLAGRFGDSADALALSVALLWEVHPLQTESVTYVIQRCESLMGLCYLVVLWAVIRSTEGRRPWVWHLVGLAALILGLGTKLVMVTAPLVVLVYDRTFLAGSFRAALRRRWPLYGGVAAVAGAALLYMWQYLWVGFFGAFHLEEVPYEMPSRWEYALTQVRVVAHYLGLAVWPRGLCLDYQWPICRSADEAFLAAVPVGGLAVLTAWAVVRRPAWGFLGVWFGLILAPTSSVVPTQDAAFEHRMYLPLAAVVATIVLGAWLAGGRLLRRWVAADARREWIGATAAVVLVGSAAVTLGTLTVLRNEDYASDLRMWSDVAAKRPENPRAQYTLGNALARHGGMDEAVSCYREALRLVPSYVEAHNNLGNALVRLGRDDEATAEFREAIRLNPGFADAFCNLGAILAMQHKREEALACFHEALRLNPDSAEARLNLQRLLGEAARGP